jgi:asparagine synthase (glutamine-hydrolysing)
MCGIAGRLNLRPGPPVTAAAITRMCAALLHRGPDDEGIELDDGFGMGMRRLSIIDVAGGRQPIASEDGSVSTVCNGEIYNFRELRRELEARGHRFATGSDAEVIVHLYEDDGDRFVARLDGMFALAVWDRRQRKLLLARDRLGIKPLFYALTPRSLRFASEIKALLAAGVDREVDDQAVHDYLALNYVPGPRPIFRAVRQLPTGATLTCVDGRIRIDRYWELRYPSAPVRPRSEASYVEELTALLSETVRRHLVSDVPLGVFLSGGLDSGSLVALMRAVSPQPVRTFSIGFADPSYDELAGARAVARAFDTEHHELVVGPPTLDDLVDLVRAFDEPFGDSSALPVAAVSRLAREHVTVALSGEGGDEVFAGYHTYAAFKVAEAYKRLPQLLGATLIPALVRCLPVSDRRVSFDYKAKRFVGGALAPPADAHYAWKVIFDAGARRALLGAAEAAVDPVEHYRGLFGACAAADSLTRLQHVDLGLYLADDLLVKADRASMAQSLEVRVPYLDHRVVEFLAAVPPSLKLRGLTKKYLLRRAMRDRLPAAIVSGPKRGFNVPVPRWLRAELRPVVHDVLSVKRVRDAGFDPRAVETFVTEHEARRADRSRELWALLMFMLWHEQYVDRGAFAPEPRLVVTRAGR